MKNYISKRGAKIKESIKTQTLYYVTKDGESISPNFLTKMGAELWVEDNNYSIDDKSISIEQYEEVYDTNEFNESNLLKRVEKLLNENKKGYSQLDKQILEDLQNKGFKKFILRYTRIYDKIYEGPDEDGYPDFSYEFSDTDWDYVKVKEAENKREFGFELEDNRIFISENEDDDSGEYPSGGTPDHITYSNYDVEFRNRYYLVNDYNEELKMSVKDYILENYPDTYVASLLLSDKVDFDNENIIDDLENEDF